MPGRVCVPAEDETVRRGEDDRRPLPIAQREQPRDGAAVRLRREEQRGGGRGGQGEGVEQQPPLRLPQQA